MENEIQNLQNQINLLQGNSFNSTVLDAKDGFYLVVNYPGQILSDYTIVIDFDAKSSTITKSILGTNFPFFTARHPMEVFWVAESHTVKGTGAGAVTLDIEKLTGTQAPGSGTSILASTFDLKGTINTVVQKSGLDLSTARQLVNGDRLCLKLTGTLTAVAGVQVTLHCKYLARGHYK